MLIYEPTHIKSSILQYYHDFQKLELHVQRCKSTFPQFLSLTETLISLAGHILYTHGLVSYPLYRDYLTFPLSHTKVEKM